MDDTELRKLFWAEVREYLDVMNQYVMALEMSAPEEDAGAFVERLRELNRVAHSMKGAARAVGVADIETLGHHMEEVFEAALKRGLAFTPDVADLIYDALDLVQGITDDETVEPDVLAQVVAQMQRVVQENATLPADDAPDPRESDTFEPVNGAATPDPTPPPEQPEMPPTDDIPHSHRNMTQTMLLRPAEDTVRVSVDKLDQLMQESSELLVTRLQSEERKQQLDRLRRQQGRWAKEWRTVRAAYIRLARKLQNEDASDDLRDLLEFLETNQRYLSEMAREVGALSTALANDNMRLYTLTDGIQNSISTLRLVPFETIMGTLQRTLRDVARETGKEAQLDVVGGATEIDKSVLEHLKDPIMHLIRNAVDHGIEPPAERDAVDKPLAGWVYLNVETRGSEIVFMVGDDGRGIDADRVRAAAVDAGIVTPTAAQNLPDDEARALIFHPGLTTRSEVTAISGRGVGMDVVREHVESLRGRVSITSRVGSGTVIVISVPVSLTRIRCVLLHVNGEQYAVPSLSVLRMEYIDRGDILTVEGRSMVEVGERTLPLVSLADMLDAPPMPPPERDWMRVMVLDAADRQVAFIVDELTSERELVLKPLGAELLGTSYISGAALLGSGEIVLVLDANDLVRGAVGAAIPVRRVSTPDEQPDPAPQKLRVLIADDSITTRTLEKNILETAGCDVRVAFDGVQAWEIMTEQPFDVVISDVEMPRMDGLVLTQRIKQSPQTRHIPVILLTSLTKPEHREAGLEAGADAYLVKSRFDQDELLRVIQSVL